MSKAKLFVAMLSGLTCLQAATISVTPGTVQVGPGELLSLGVMISDVSDLYAFQFDIAYDPTILSATSVVEGTFLPSGNSIFIPGTIDKVHGQITSTAGTLTGAVSGTSGTGVLAVLQLRSLGGGSSKIDVSNIILLDSTLINVPASVVSGSVTAIPEPSTLVLWTSASLLLALASRTRCRVKSLRSGA